MSKLSHYLIYRGFPQAGNLSIVKTLIYRKNGLRYCAEFDSAEDFNTYVTKLYDHFSKYIE